MKDISISKILEDLNRGLTRSPKSNGYNPEVGSIQEKYELEDAELAYVFKHEKLKHRKAKKPVLINLIDDLEEDKVEEVNYINNSGLVAEDFDAYQETIKKAVEANNNNQ